jgi:uncharacterized phiE125 gp8 family phage protein
MPYFLLTPPAAEPLTLAETKVWLRVEHDADDAPIAALIAAARTQIEAATRRALMTQTWRIVLDAWPRDGRVRLGRAPPLALLAARTIDADGAPRALETASFVLDKAGLVLAAPPWSLPTPGRAIAGIELDLSFGYGATGADAPAPLRQAMRMLIARWYATRAAAAGDAQAAPWPGDIAALVAPYRVLAP